MKNKENNAKNFGVKLIASLMALLMLLGTVFAVLAYILG